MNPVQPPDALRVDEMVRAALEEDGAGADVTSELIGLGDRRATGEIVVSAPVVLCGVDVAHAVFRRVDASCEFEALHRDGERLQAGETACWMTGRATTILTAERTALNFLQRMSGVATLASRFVEAVRGTGTVILDTRKTIPLWRDLDKYAVRCGGARNHRLALDAMVLVKDNHLRTIGGVAPLIERIDAKRREGVFVEVEVDSITLLEAILPAGVDRIMLDNFTPAQVAQALDRVRAFRSVHPGARFEIEVSGGVTLENVRAYAQPGVDFISVGAITHSAPAAAMSLQFS